MATVRQDGTIDTSRRKCNEVHQDMSNESVLQEQAHAQNTDLASEKEPDELSGQRPQGVCVLLVRSSTV